MTAFSEPCFHCGAAVAADSPLTIEVDGQTHPVCCPGCAAVAQSIVETGLGDFYRFRSAPAPRPGAHCGCAQEDPWQAFDRPAVLAEIATRTPAGVSEAVVLLEGVRCAACAWLIESSLGRLAGVESVEVNPATCRALLRWRADRVGLGALLREIARLGYEPHPLTPDAAEDVARRERQAALKRLAVAGLGMMQVMTFAVALYAGVFQSMDAAVREYLELVSLLVATPVVLYAGQPFFAGAWRDLSAGRAGMDVPVALAVGGAYAASVWQALVGGGAIYFDSVTMFVFLLSLGRYAEMMVRHRALRASEALVCSLPPTAVRVRGSEHEYVAAKELQPGDLVVVRPGDTVPADGTVEDGISRVDESLLTGESRARERVPGDRLVAGSVNVTGRLHLRVERVGRDTVVAAIGRLLERARAERPPIARLADRIASRFVLGVLLAAAGVALYWWHARPEDAFRITLAVLVVTCPCALSLATPAALSAAIGGLARRGLLTVNGGALETLARVNRIVFDKTGTLTRGCPEIEDVELLGDHSRAEALAIGAALESGSAHPLATAFRRDGELTRAASSLREHPGRGLEGVVGGRRYRIGTPDFVCAGRTDGAGQHAPGLGDDGARGVGTRVELGDASGLIARFHLSDTLRPDALATVAALHGLGLETEIASGDDRDLVASLARRMGIDQFAGRLTPEAKLARLRDRQCWGEVVAMVGDGVNDAPTLAGADVSIAAGSSAPLAQASADMVLLGERLAPLADAVETARRLRRILAQNVAWAIAYNALALPIAATGLVQPWMAALGMSASSLLVVANATRLSRSRPPAAVIEPVHGALPVEGGTV